VQRLHEGGPGGAHADDRTLTMPGGRTNTGWIGFVDRLADSGRAIHIRDPRTRSAALPRDASTRSLVSNHGESIRTGPRPIEALPECGQVGGGSRVRRGGGRRGTDVFRRSRSPKAGLTPSLGMGIRPAGSDPCRILQGELNS